MKWLLLATCVLGPLVVCTSCSDSNGVNSTDAGPDVVDSGTTSDGPSGGDAGGEDAPTHRDATQPVLTGKHLWSKKFGNDPNGSVAAPRIGTDPTGNVYAGGYFTKSVDFGGGVLTSAGGYDVFIAKFDPDGNHLWSKRFGAAGNEAGALALDPAGGLYLFGNFDSSVDFGGGALISAGGLDAFVVRFDSNGKHVWSKRFGDAGDQRFDVGAVLAGSAVVLTGRIYSGSIDLGGGAMSAGTAVTPFLAKLDASGGHVWSKSFSVSGMHLIQDIGAEGNGNVVVGGFFQETVDFGGGPLTSTPSGANDAFVAKFASGGAHVWSKQYGDQATDQIGSGVAIDGTGNIFVTGSGNGTIDFGTGPVSLNPGVFLTKLDANAVGQWAKGFGFRTGVANPVASASDGNPVIGGNYYGPMDFGGGPLPDGNDSAYLARFDSAGKHAWSKGWSGRNFGLAIDSAGNVLVSGVCFGTINIGGAALPCGSSPEYDLLIAKFGP